MPWKATTNDKQEILEGKKNWVDIQDTITQLAFMVPNGPTIVLPRDMEKYYQAKTASAELNGSGKDVNIESRYIGFKIGNNIIKIRVDEKTKNITVEVNNA